MKYVVITITPPSISIIVILAASNLFIYLAFSIVNKVPKKALNIP